LRKKFPDKKKAISIVTSAEEDIKYTLTINPSESSANTIVRNVYESFRMLGESILINAGIEISDHITSINELLKLKIKSERPINLIEQLRTIRHKINYNGYRATIYEAEEALSLAKSCFGTTKIAVLNEISKPI